MAEDKIINNDDGDYNYDHDEIKIDCYECLSCNSYFDSNEVNEDDACPHCGARSLSVIYM